MIDDRSDRAVKQWLESTDAVAFVDPPHSTGVAYNWNVGISAALLDGCAYTLVVNNDIIFHPGTIDLLVERVRNGDVSLVTAHDIGGTYRDPSILGQITASGTGEDDRPEFPCFMLTENTIRSVGWFDEGFEGAYFEDNDYHARLVLAGYRGVRLLNAPVFHYGCATVRSQQDVSIEITAKAERNKEYFRRKWGSLPVNTLDEMRTCYYPTPFDSGWRTDPAQERIDELFIRACDARSDISGHLDLLYRLSSTVNHITEISGGLSTCAFLRSKPCELVVYNPPGSAHLTLVEAAARLAGQAFVWHRQAGPENQIDDTDLLFVDTAHDDAAMRELLNRHADKVRRYLVFHDTVTFGDRGEHSGSRGKWPAISDYVRGHPRWRLIHHASHDHGLTIFERAG